MPEFGFSEEQDMFRQETRRFARRELVPLVKTGKFDDLRKKGDEMGWNRVNFPERVGGWKLDRVSTAILLEELALSETSAAGNPFQSTFTGEDLKHLCNEVQDELAPKLINRTCDLKHHYTEANSGNEQAAIRTRAVRQGEYYVINGEKQASAGSMGATHSVITCKTDPAAEHKGISMILVPTNTPGVTRSPLPFMTGSFKIPKEDPSYGGGHAIMSLDDVKVPAKYRLGEEGEGMAMWHVAYSWARLCACTLPHVCAARLTLQEIIEYTKKRAHFGSPLIQFEGVSFEIAEHYTQLDAARMLVYRALWLWDQGLPYSKEVSMAKLFGCAAAVRALHDCLMIGGYAAYSLESPIQERLRAALGLEIADGNAQIQKLHILKHLVPEALPAGMHERFI